MSKRVHHESLGARAILGVAAHSCSAAPSFPRARAARKLRVVATIPDLKSLAEAVGGDLVEVEASPAARRTSTRPKCARA